MTFVFDDPLAQIVFTGSPKLLEATIALQRKLTGLDESELPTIVHYVHRLLLHIRVEAKVSLPQKGGLVHSLVTLAAITANITE